MKAPLGSAITRRFLFQGLPFLLISAIFILDLTIPRGTVVCAGYILPILIYARKDSRARPLAACPVIILLIFTAFLFHPQSPFPSHADLLNRIIISAAGLLVADVLQSRKRAVAIAEESLDAQERLKALNDHTPALVFLKDEEGRYVYLNATYEKEFVKSRDWFGKTDFDFWPKESAELFRRNDMDILLSGETRQILEDSTDMQGNRHCWLCYKFPFTDSRQRRYLGGIGIDATARILAEEALKKSEAELAEAQRITQTGSWSYTLANDRINWSEELYRIFGMEKSEFGGEYISFITRVHPDDRPAVLRKNAEARINGEPFEIEYRIILPDGSMRNIREIGYSTKDAHGQVMNLVGTAQDVTERKLAQKALLESEEKYRTLFNSLNVGFCVIDVIFDTLGKPVDWRYVELNVVFEKLGGPLAAQGKLISELMPDIEKHWLEFYGKVAKTGISGQMENKLGEKWFDVYAFKIGDRKSRQVAALFYDITLWKSTEAEIQRRAKETAAKLLKAERELDKAKRLSDIGTLASTVAHELRNPLAAIAIAAHNIRKKMRDPLCDRHIASIEKKISESDQIIGNLLFYSKLRPPQLNEINLAETVRECLRELKHLTAKVPGIEIEANEIRKTLVSADGVQIKEVLNNLLHNAVDALQESKGGKIEVGISDSGEQIAFYIKDTGIGMSRATLLRAAEPFYTTKSNGTGLGLTVSKQIVELHNGSLHIESEVKKGTTVTVILPKAR